MDRETKTVFNRNQNSLCLSQITREFNCRSAFYVLFLWIIESTYKGPAPQAGPLLVFYVFSGVFTIFLDCLLATIHSTQSI
ncbi:hypothetical protein BU24DRAFT_427789 [Aaosphaeria arxii CBS 175.79]|uniref:Uncharacterized protein n=1 Tax=Aaosphaeria arxii CBS 175.79 TaxID=1450172 RepID=A0A6A5XCZ4_9PLEO|nr:uncharacterized protein BU24DRAFT_427789 [Aaosphaeria arxii CBS 175.79]KAF2010677.1 hypothetical protein BU24DRAFT_427789 [Aaosphaeria arxii CBS 175.79]